MKGLPIWTVYENPTDYPGQFVARLWHGTEPTGEMMLFEDLAAVRHAMLRKALYRLPRRPEDDPVIVETWI